MEFRQLLFAAQQNQQTTQPATIHNVQMTAAAARNYTAVRCDGDGALSQPKETDELSIARVAFRNEATFDLSAEYLLTQHRNLGVQQFAYD